MGGKAIHTKWIIPQLPEPDTFDTYVEVFGGAFWIYIKGFKNRLEGKTVIYNDADPFMANSWWAMSQRREDLRDLCSELPAHDLELYTEFKEEIEPLDWDDVHQGDIELAKKYLYLVTQRFVAPGYKLPKPSSGKWERFVKDLDAKAPILDNILAAENLDFQEVIEKYDSPRTLFYVDPPYYSTEKYYHHEFPKSDHLRLAECLKKIQGRFALSYYEFPELSEWFPESEYPWYRHAAKNMMGTKKGKKIDTSIGSKDIEVLVKNYSANDALSDAKKELIEF